MPVDFDNDNANMGYAFINFINPLFILEFSKQFDRKTWKTQFYSHKQTELKYGKIQGLNNLMEHFRQSSVMRQEDYSTRPRFFEQNDKNQLREDLQAEIDKCNCVFALDVVMDKMQLEEDEMARQRNNAQQQFYQMQQQQQFLYPQQ